jgi:Tol biopolymer transport system component
MFDGGTAVSDPVPFTPTVDWVSNKIYYTSSRVGVLNNEPNLYTISLSGGGKVGPLTSSSAYPLYDPSVSQDGTKVAFTQVASFSSANILLLDLGTGLVTTISSPSFAPYSEMPVFVRR